MKRKISNFIAFIFGSRGSSAGNSKGLGIIRNGNHCVVVGLGRCTDTDIVIPSKYRGAPVTKIEDSAFKYCSSLTSITIPNSVASIGDRAFYCCCGLKSIIIPNSITSISDKAFDGCSSLTSMTIPNSVTSIGDGAFSGCSNLTSITIPNSVASIGDVAFSGCSSLTSITIPDSVTSVGNGAFSACESLTNITIPNSVASIGNWAFDGCNGLRYNIYDNAKYLGNKNNPYVVLIKATGDLITSCSIHENTKRIYNFAFKSCHQLTNITFGENSRLTSIGDKAFEGCSRLTNVEIPNSVISIGDSAFYGSSLKSINIPDSVISIGREAFFACSSLTSIMFGENSQLTSISDNAFYYCRSLTSITIPNSVTTIGGLAFGRCDKLTIYCEAKVKPGSWSSDWNSSNRPVVWDCKNQ